MKDHLFRATRCRLAKKLANKRRPRAIALILGPHGDGKESTRSGRFREPFWVA
jgi:hypothetical protein